jgi:hypothetical protein
MKTTILALAITVAAVAGINASSSAATRNEEVTNLNEVTRISKIEIHGNVELYVSDGQTDNAKVYNKYYSENAMVQDQNGVLRITSYSAQKLVVWITVSDLREIAAYDNAEVKSFGKLSALDLDVKLHDHTLATLNLDAYAARITLQGKSKADLTGTIEEGAIKYDRSAYLNITNLVAANMTKNTSDIKACKRAAELASL